jgi:hypothetical protein
MNFYDGCYCREDRFLKRLGLLRDWLRDPDNRSVLVLLGLGVAGLASVYVYFHPPVPSPPINPQPVIVTIHYKVCRGEYEERCAHHDVFVGCGDPVDSAKKACLKFNSTLLSDEPGKECGYAIADISCSVNQ